MTEASQKNQDQANGSNFAIQRIYVKDISFEAPKTPEVFTQTWTPEMNLEISNASQKLSDDVFEVSIRLTLTTKANDEVAYICEATQAGIFTISGLNEAQLQHCLGAYCPNILFPYARETISSLVNKATFPTVNLDPVNFDALFANYLQQQNAQAPAGNETIQ